MDLSDVQTFWKWPVQAVFPLLHAGRAYRSQSSADGSRASNRRSASNSYRAQRMGLCERTLVAAHGNSLRALIMVLERLTPEGIVARELLTGVPIIDWLNADATVVSMRDLAA